MTDYDLLAMKYNLKDCGEFLEKYKEMILLDEKIEKQGVIADSYREKEGLSKREYKASNGGFYRLYHAVKRRKYLLELEERVQYLENLVQQIAPYHTFIGK